MRWRMFVGLKPKTPKPFNYSWYLISVQCYPIVDIVALEESEVMTRNETYGQSGTQLSSFLGDEGIYAGH